MKKLLPQAKLHIISGVENEVNKTAPQVIADILNESITKSVAPVNSKQTAFQAAVDSLAGLC